LSRRVELFTVADTIGDAVGVGFFVAPNPATEVPTTVTPFTEWIDTSEKHAGEEPLPGYRLIAPLGRGGFGEVWKCEAPGGLLKAIKFVPARGDRFRQELDAFEQVKAIRHPYLLTLERVEQTDEELVMVMELADCQLHDRVRQCRADGLPGIPREELLGYVREAAEALDMIGNRFGLQHLDVKPENLFLVAGHVKVGDYGLVRRAAGTPGQDDDPRGFTPRYTAPEVLSGRIDSRSDQYSLALVYVELLTGTFPFSGRSAHQLILQHSTAAPDLSRLPDTDRLAVERALSKNPLERFPTCLAFARALTAENQDRPRPSTPGGVLFALEAPPGVPPPGQGDPTPLPPALAAPQLLQQPADERTDEPQPETREPEPTTQIRRLPVRRGVQRGTVTSRTEPPPPPDPLKGLQPVQAVDQIRKKSPSRVPRPDGLSPHEFVRAVVKAAASVAASNGVETPPEEASVCRFLCTLPVAMVPLKLVTVAERWGMSAKQATPSRVVMKREDKRETRKPCKAEPPPPPSKLEVVVQFPVPPAAEFVAVATRSGSSDEEFDRKARQDVPGILEDIRAVLQNLDERRRDPRFAVRFPVRVYPLYSDGVVGEPISGECRDVSGGGVQFVTRVPVRTERLFVEFEGVQAVAGQAVLVGVVRTWHDNGGQVALTAGRFRNRP
jgi:serine/threonine protein kinase